MRLEGKRIPAAVEIAWEQEWKNAEGLPGLIDIDGEFRQFGL
jgi:hypothetical protein